MVGVGDGVAAAVGVPVAVGGVGGAAVTVGVGDGVAAAVGVPVAVGGVDGVPLQSAWRRGCRCSRRACGCWWSRRGCRYSRSGGEKKGDSSRLYIYRHLINYDVLDKESHRMRSRCQLPCENERSRFTRIKVRNDMDQFRLATVYCHLERDRSRPFQPPDVLQVHREVDDD